MTIETTDLKQRTNLLDLIGADTRLRKVARTGGGEFAGPCPFCGGHDRFRVQPERGRWWCRQCSPDDHWHDAIEYVQRRDGLGFRDACERLGATTAHPRRATDAAARPQRKLSPPVVEDAEPTAEWRERASAIVAECEAALWSEGGARARTWLHARGLRDETLRHWRVGYNPRGQEMKGLWVPSGILLPWQVHGALWQVKVRTPRGEPKYTAVAGGHPWLYGADTLLSRRVAVLTEGEFDAMLLYQEAGDVVGVATLGSCSKRLGIRAMRLLLPITRLLVAYDTDDDGEEGALHLLGLSRRMRRMKPPCGKDVTEFWLQGGRLRDWVLFHLARA